MRIATGILHIDRLAARTLKAHIVRFSAESLL
jgi:hypothetical protein